MRILTAGESHGEFEAAIIEGFPRGVAIDENTINHELSRRQAGYGRGKRMSIESDHVKIVSGLRNKISLGSPITLLVRNGDHKIFTQGKDDLAPITLPRPAHADLAGFFKYGDKDCRNILERASARETVMRVAAGSACKQFLNYFDIKIASFVRSLGKIDCVNDPENIGEIIAKTQNSPTGCLDSAKAKAMMRLIDAAQKKGDSLGGVAEIWVTGLVPGLGSFMQYDQRLDAQFASALMSIPSVKGVEVGLGFDYSRMPGSTSHDEIFYNSTKGFYHKTNHSGGIEGGMSNGETVILRMAVKPIATLTQPLNSVDIISKKSAKAAVVRSDTCAVLAAGVIAESMAAIVVTQAMLQKFGGDSLKEIQANYRNYLKSLK